MKKKKISLRPEDCSAEAREQMAEMMNDGLVTIDSAGEYSLTPAGVKAFSKEILQVIGDVPTGRLQ